MKHPHSPGDAVIFTLDRLTVRGGRITAWGWCLHRDRPLSAMELQAVPGGESIRVQYPLPRDDVQAVYPNTPWARASGFFLTTRLPAGTESCEFHGIDMEGNRLFLARPDDLPGETGSGRTVSSARRMLHKAYAHIRQGNFKGLSADAITWAKRQRPQHPLEAAELARRVRRLVRPAALIIDHNMGGGANTAREETITGFLGDSHDVLLLYFDIPGLSYRWELRTAEGTEHFVSHSLDHLDALLRLPQIEEVILNNSVGFDDPLAVNRSLTRAVHSGVIRLRFTLHDYFSICPSFPLLDRHGRYCGVTHEAECGHCMQENNADFMNLVPRTPIAVWRSCWLELLQACCEIVAFSAASIEILLRAFPELPRTAVSLSPHDCAHIDLPRVCVDLRAPLHIGIVGHITYLKGAQVVADLITEIENRGLDTRLTVFGDLDHAIASKHLTVLKRYRPDTLPKLLAQSGANIYFFPSIWPETFSFVVQELMALDVPLAAFRLGAPAERIAGYRRGRLIDTGDAPEILDDLLRFHSDLQAGNLSDSLRAGQPMVVKGLPFPEWLPEGQNRQNHQL